MIERDFPRHWRRASGYNLPELLREDAFNGARLITSSEGTLAFGTEYTIGLVPVPTMTAMVILQFDDIVASMEVVTTILECEPSAVELMDGMLIGLTRQQPAFARQIEFIKGNPQAILTVEFYGESDKELHQKVERLKSHLTAHHMTGDAEMIELFDPKQQAGVWSVRKSGQGLLMSTRGDAKPIACIEDVSVPVEHLPEYVREVLQAGRGSWHYRRLLRARQRGLSPRAPAGQHEVGRRREDHALPHRARRRAGDQVRWRHEWRAWGWTQPRRAEREGLRPGDLPVLPRAESGVRSGRTHESRESGRFPVNDR